MISTLKNLGSKAALALAKRFDVESVDDHWRIRNADVDSYTDPRSPQERAFCEQYSNETEMERLRRRCSEYFDIIERIEKERDGLWRMWRESTSEHLNAQALLERHLMSTRKQLGQAVVMLNKMRKQQSLEPVKKPAQLEPYEGEPIGGAKAYAENMIKLCGKFSDALETAKPSMTDGKEERQKISDA